MFNCDGFLAFWLEAVTRVWLSWAAPLQRKTGKYYPHVQTSERAACFKTKNVQVVAAADSESKETKSRGNRTNVLRSSPPERLMLLSTHGHVHTCVCVYHCFLSVVKARHAPHSAFLEANKKHARACVCVTKLVLLLNFPFRINVSRCFSVRCCLNKVTQLARVKVSLKEC